jgi:hypothetical protein
VITKLKIDSSKLLWILNKVIIELFMEVYMEVVIEVTI